MRAPGGDLDRRRAVIGVVAGALGVFAPAIHAASTAKVYRIGSLCVDGAVPYFWRQLRELGYREHVNVEYVFKDEDVSADLPGFAAKLAAQNVDVIVACTNQEAAAAMRVTSRIPIVLLYGIVPVEVGLVASLARPGGNVTGSAAISTDLARKSVEVLKNAVPTIRKLAVIVNLEDPVGKVLHAATEEAARVLGLSVTTWQVTDDASLAAAFAGIERNRPDGLSVSVSVVDHFPKIIEFAAAHRLPAMYPFAPAVRSGGLMAYSPNWIPQSQRNAMIVDRILKGSQARDIPVEQPLLYAFSINLKTARAMSLTFPKAVMLQATAVIE